MKLDEKNHETAPSKCGTYQNVLPYGPGGCHRLAEEDQYDEY